MLEIIQRIKGLFGADSLKGKCTRGGTALAGSAVLSQGTRFVRTVILVRLLAKEDFGLMAMVLASVGMFQAFTEVGVRMAVIQNPKGARPEFLNVAWWFSAVRGLVLYGLAFAVAPLVAQFYEDPRLVPLLRVSFLYVLFIGLVSPRLHVLEKEFRFARWVILSRASSIASALLTIGLGIFYPNVWVLVIGFVTEALLSMLLSHIFCPFIPSLHINRTCLKEVAHFARGMFGLPILASVFKRADTLIIPKMLTIEALGIYSLARNLAMVPVEISTVLLGSLLLPAFSSLQSDLAALRRAVVKLSRAALVLTGPMVAVMVAFAGPILLAVLKVSSSSARLVFSAFAVFVAVQVLTIIATQVNFAIGRPDLHRRFVAIRVALLLMLIFPGLHWLGLPGAACAILLSSVVALIVQVSRLGMIIKLEWHDYLSALFPGVVCSLLVAVPGVALAHMLRAHPFVSVAVAAALCLTAWAAGLVWLHMAGNRRAPGQSIVGVGAAEQEMQ